LNKHRFGNAEKIETGQQASMIASVVVPYIHEKITEYVQQLAGLYRGGLYTHDQIIGKVAEITALLNLMAHLEGQQRQGDIAADKEYSGGSQTPQ